MAGRPPPYTSTPIETIENLPTLRGDVPARSYKTPGRLAADEAFIRAKTCLRYIAPNLTLSALEDLSVTVFGIPAGLLNPPRSFVHLIASLTLDVLKAPIALACGVGNLLMGGMHKAVGGIQGKDQKQAMEDILESFQKRFLQTLTLLIHLEIETPRSLYQQFQDGNINRYMTLAILVTAFASRRIEPKKICLATGTSLSRKHCPEKGLALFDLILELKDHLILAGTPVDRNAERASLFCQKWFPAIAEALANGIDSISTPRLDGIETDSTELKEMRTIIKTLSEVQTEIAQIDPDLSKLQGMPVHIAQHMPNHE